MSKQSSLWVHPPKTEGISSKQAHTDLPAGKDGKITFERELGQQGFSGPATHMYHKNPPCDWDTIAGELKHRAYDTRLLQTVSTSPWNATELLHNNHVRIRYWQCDSAMTSLARNADGDELIFFHQGEGDLYCDYGHLSFAEGDYILLPKGTLWRIEVTQSVKCLLIEATQDHYRLPDKGIVGSHAVFDPAVLITPEIDQHFTKQYSDDTAWNIQIKRLNNISLMNYPYNPLDAIGWHGNLMPVKLNWRDIRPLMSHRYHLPPSAHTLFTCENFIISTFVPRPLESDPDALRVPFYHNNDDYDEVIFYHHGNFFSRDNIESGMISLHPAGLTHGPHPKAYDTGKNYDRKETDEVAIMIDARFPLEATTQANKIEMKDYINAWKHKKS